MKKPNFFIVGAPKCGTTSLYSYLRQHPDIFMPDNKEPQFFCPDLQISPDWIVDGTRYLKLFEKAGQVSRIGEASTWYLYSKESAKLIKEFSSNAKIIIMLRNPIDMINSLHLELINQGNEDILDLEEAINLESKRRLGLSIPAKTRLPRCLAYTDIANFKPQIERYFDCFGRDAVKVIIFDDFKSDAFKVYQEVLAFLDVDTNFKPNLEPQRTSRSLNFVDLYLKRLASENRRFSSYVKKLPPSVLNFYRKFSVFLGPRVRNKEIDPKIQVLLRKKFSSQIEQLSELLDRDMTFWFK